jgi:integrase
MSRPTRRADSQSAQFRKRLPADIAAKGIINLTFTLPAFEGHPEVLVSVRAKGTVKLSLRTNVAAVAKARTGAVLEQLERQLQAHRSGPKPLTHKQTVALAGQLYFAFADSLEDNPGPGGRWVHVEEVNAKALAGQYGTASLMIGTKVDKTLASLEQRFGPLVDAILAKHAVVPDATSRATLLREAAKQMNAAAAKLKRNAAGDYSSDSHAGMIPSWTGTTKPTAPGAYSLKGLLDDWKKHAVPSKRLGKITVKGYEAAVSRFIAFIGHDNIAQITDESFVRFAEARVAAGVNPTTVNNGDLGPLKSILGWAKSSKRITDNHAKGVRVPVGVKQQLRPKGFTNDEALAILKAAVSYEAPKAEKPHTTAAKRWVPWLCAFTGARVGEMLQLRKKDVSKDEDGHWQIVITPEAGSVKTGKARAVPLHPQLIEIGFVKFAISAKDGYLFLPPGTKDGNHRGGVKNRLQDFVRGIVPDPNVQPNHGWRHRFITLARRYQIPEGSCRMITGHSGKTVDEVHYGDPAGLYEHICKLPSYPTA